MTLRTYQHELVLARRRRGLSRKQVASLLGYRDPGTIADYENGRIRPPLVTALRLEILYRRPVAFLFPELYSELRTKLRAQEDKVRSSRKRVLLDEEEVL
jgi:transcriptional regulator with XRE-family HTH domain